ncbi:MAG: sugar transferase [Gammaproteobacteria bacterium]|nr:sugar transferase [Gammaproteobacteria bacterium]
MLKRAFDILASALALTILAPALLMLAVWIRLDSTGPVLFRQQRLGLRQTPFRVLKFRTMVARDPDAIDQHQEQVVSAGADPRITRAGRVLRATSLDELPQLWNILVGEMSCVGPRPVLPEQLEAIPADCRARFAVRPGLTGLAQVRGRRTLDWLEQLSADVEYVKRQSLWLDLGIVLRTVYVVLTAQGLYGDAGRNWRAYRGQGSVRE